MGNYVDPGNIAFRRINGSDYVDKTMLIDLINARIGTDKCLVCVSRPRRFGKSYAAKMLTAYYDASCDSHSLFDDKKIAESPSYEEHLNQYHVINLDITSFISTAKREGISLREIPVRIIKTIREELSDIIHDLPIDKSLEDCLTLCVDKTDGKQFIFIIDEWDAMIREAKDDPTAQEMYLNLLRGWFKNSNFTPKAVAAAYMTGILPIKKDGSQSAISDFDEYPILYPGEFAEYTGFTENEVIRLCQKHEVDFLECKAWYDGYDFPGHVDIYNPYSVMCAIQNKKCRSYWKKTSASESLFSYINMNFDGLQEIITRLISGEEIEVDVDDFENDFGSFKDKDDVLTLLVHLGYLTYHENEGTVRIPNQEIFSEYHKFLKSSKVNNEWVKLLDASKQLLDDTIAGKTETVIETIKNIRHTNYAPTFYNNEQALRYVIKFAYIYALGQYMKVEELPSGHGIADVVYIPKRFSPLPSLLIELKWDKSDDGAIKQIKENDYPALLAGYGGDIVLVGINYDPSTDEHSCVIERLSIK